MICNKCGAEITDGASFCASCGNPVYSVANNIQQNTVNNFEQTNYQQYAGQQYAGQQYQQYPNPQYPNQPVPGQPSKKKKGAAVAIGCGIAAAVILPVLIILGAILGPQFVKYVAKSRDAMVSSAAEDVLATAKSEFALTHLDFAYGATKGTIVITAENEYLDVRLYNLVYCDDYGNSGEDAFEAQCGIDTTQTVKSDLSYTITIERSDFGVAPTFSMEQGTDYYGGDDYDYGYGDYSYGY